MPRRARAALTPGGLYHVYNRTPNQAPMFDDPLDYLLFLAFLAEACVHFGLICHCFCLMGTHFHLILEDPRGMLSLFMHRLESGYVRYFNPSRPRPRRGPLVENRFKADLIDSRDYFEAACAYVLHNPLRTASPLALTPEAYPWSSARLLTTDGLSPSQWAGELLARFGGIDAVLAALPPSPRSSTREWRRRRLEAFADGAWTETSGVLAERSPADYRQWLAARRGAPSPFPEPRPGRPRADAEVAPDDAPAHADDASPGLPAPPPARPLPSRPAPYLGLELADARDTIELECERARPVPLADGAEPVPSPHLHLYELWRFTRASLEQIAEAAGEARARVQEAIAAVRSRRGDPGWASLLWRLEWRLRWRLLAGPARA